MRQNPWNKHLAVTLLTLGSVGLGTSLAFGAAARTTTKAAQSAAPTPGDRADQGATPSASLTEFVQGGLDRVAARLQIRASQEPQWKDFEGAFKALVAAAAHAGSLAPAEGVQGNGAALLHMSADRTMRRAQALEKLADTASNLQDVLDANQRDVFAQIVRLRLVPHAMRLRGFMNPAAADPAPGDPPAAAAADPPGGGGAGGSRGGGFHGSGGVRGAPSGGGFRGGGFPRGSVPGGVARGVPHGVPRGIPRGVPHGGTVPGGFRGRFYGHGYPGWWWGPGWLGLDLYLASLPWYYQTYVWDDVPYYYVNGDYYVWNGDADEYEQVQPPSQIEEQGPGQAPAADARLFVYPKNGQTAQQQAQDEGQCSSWASNQTGYTPPAAGTAASADSGATPAKRQDYLRAYGACLEARGYSVG